MTGCYGDITQFPRNECTWLLQEVSRLEEEADHLVNTWEHTWKSLDFPPPRRTVSHCDGKYKRFEMCNAVPCYEIFKPICNVLTPIFCQRLILGTRFKMAAIESITQLNVDYPSSLYNLVSPFPLFG